MNMVGTVRRMHNARALTLIEFLVVIAILALVVLVLLNAGHRGHDHRPIRDMSNLRQIGIAMVVYAEDHTGILPEHPRDAKQYFDGDSYESHDMWLNPYQNDDAVVDRGDFEGVATRFGGYVYINLGDNIYNIVDPTKTILAYSAKVSEKQDRRGVLFVDGHAEIWEEEQLRAALPEGVDIDALDGP